MASLADLAPDLGRLADLAYTHPSGCTQMFLGWKKTPFGVGKYTIRGLGGKITPFGVEKYTFWG